jgi:hypothetical protein
VTGEAQRISDRHIESWRLSLNHDPQPQLGQFNWPMVLGRLLDENDRLTAALADRDRELAELRAKIAEIHLHVPDSHPFRGSCAECEVVWPCPTVAALASSGSAPTGQEER